MIEKFNLIIKQSNVVIVVQVVFLMLIPIGIIFGFARTPSPTYISNAFIWNFWLFIVPIIILYWREKYGFYISSRENGLLYKKQIYDLNTRFYIGAFYTYITLFILAFLFGIIEIVSQPIIQAIELEQINGVLDINNYQQFIKFIINFFRTEYLVEFKDVIGWSLTALLGILGFIFGYIKVLTQLVDVKYKFNKEHLEKEAE